MINERAEFCAYTGTVSYTASKKSDTTWLGRFTFATILEFEGMARILTILARGYLFHSKDGAVISGDPHDRVDHARRALCAWCSVPENGKRVQDDVLADALELGPLRREEPELPPELTDKVKAALPKEIPSEVVCTLIRYYLANRQDDCEWVVLPVANFDAYFGDTSFSKKYLPKIPAEIVERSNAFGISRYRVTEKYLP